MTKLVEHLQSFISDTYRDQRIPARDKKVIIFILIILVLRTLFVSDWIPYFGILDILFLMGVIGDYFFRILDQNLLLSHYPWGMKSFARIKRFANFLGIFAPYFVTDHLWEYTKDPF
ncbi:MAG: hypothetical protein EHM20_08565 [Alphaproteobacteria bacterium]|nr:MAG: hypothetical protein EHM20_08565 [Alphaproteobacteria bacterium]